MTNHFGKGNAGLFWRSLLFVVIGLALTGIWIGYWHYAPSFVPGAGSEEKGQFGDMFGALNTLFSGLALAALISTVFLQLLTLRDQRNDLKAMEKIQTNSAEALSQQAGASVFALKVQALNSLIAALSSQLAHTPVSGKDSMERELLRHEMNDAIGDLRNLLASKGHDAFKDLPLHGSTTLTDDDVVQLIHKYVSYTKPDEIRTMISRISDSLARHAIQTKERLERLLKREDLRNIVETIYIEDLLRHPDHPLDPLATVVWPTVLFNGKSENELREALRSSHEYAQKHRPIPPLHYSKEYQLSLPFAVHCKETDAVKEAPNWRDARVTLEKLRKVHPGHTYTLFRVNFDSTDNPQWEQVQ